MLFSDTFALAGGVSRLFDYSYDPPLNHTLPYSKGTNRNHTYLMFGFSL